MIKYQENVKLSDELQREVPEMEEVEKKKKRKLSCGQSAARLKPLVPAPVEPSADYSAFMEAFLRFAEEDVNAKLEVLLKDHEENILLKKKSKLDDCEPEKLKEIINLCKSGKGFLNQMDLLDKEGKPDWTEFLDKPFTCGKQGPLTGILASPQPSTDEKLILQNFMKKHCELYKKSLGNRTGFPDLKEEVGREEDMEEEEDLEDVKLGREDALSSTSSTSQPATPNFGDKLQKHLWPEKFEQEPKIYSHQCYPLTKEDSFMPDSLLQLRGEEQFRREWNSAPLDTLQRIKEDVSKGKFQSEAVVAETKNGAQKLKKKVALKDTKKEDKKLKLDQSHLNQESLKGKQSAGSVPSKGSLKEARIDASDLAAYRAIERQASALPGPGKYDVPRWPFQQNLVQNVVPFNSKTKRVMTVGPGSKDVPGCGSYNVRHQWNLRFGPMPVQSSFGGVQTITPAFHLRCGDKLTEKCVGCGNVPKTAEYWYSFAFGVMCNECYKKEELKHNMYNTIELKTFMPSRHCSAVHEHCGKNTHLLRPKKELQTLFRKEAYFAQFVDDNKKKLKRPTAKDITNWHRRKRCLIDSLRTGNEEITYTSKKVKRIPRTASSSDQKIPEFSYIKVPPNVLKLRTPPWPDVLKGIRALEEDIPGRKTPPEWEERESVDLEGSKEKVEEQGEEEEDALEKDEDVEDAIQEEVKEEKVVEEEEEELQEVGDEDEEMTVYNSATEIQRVVQMMGGVPPIPEARPKIDLAKTLPPLLRRELPVQVIKLNKKYIPWFLRRQMEGRDASIVEKDDEKRETDPGMLKLDEEEVYKKPESRTIKDTMSFGAHWFHHSQQAFISKALGEILKEEAANVKSPKEIIEECLAEPIEHKYVSFKVVQLNDAKRLLEQKKKEKQNRYWDELYEKTVSKARAVPTLDTPSEQKSKIAPRKLHFYAYDQ
ncbi:uncharacterized protein isoform X3 [Rhodnius prolixus]|uniref:uncharacterized protein isoform X3 n=1 Tax=Rhodnius prolixus TaxID=13249 RepID=UPI003D188E11